MTPKDQNRGDCPLVIIRWEDSAQPLAAWQHLSRLKPAEPIECATVGWLVRDDATAKVVCQSIGGLGNPENAQASGIMTIPTRCVLSIENLSQEALPASVPEATADDCNRRAHHLLQSSLPQPSLARSSQLE